MKSAIYTYHFRRYLGRNLTRAEAAVIGPLEKMRIRGLERRLLVVDPPGVDTRGILCAYVEYLRKKVNPHSDILIMTHTSQDVDWTVESSRCTREHLDQSLRPAIKPVDINFAEVDTVFIGFPIWWHEEPAVIRTFLDNYREQLKGKTLYPFCTSYESPMSEADATLRKGYPTLDWKTGLRLPASPAKIREWINQ